VILGTPDYMSPEQAMGKTVDQRSDIFSAGAVFYEFLTARKPFPGKTLHSVLYRIVSGRPDPMLALSPELPARLCLIVHRMLEKDPKKRYASMEDVSRDLSRIHAALRRSHGRSVLPPAKPTAPEAGDEARALLRDHLKRGRAFQAAGNLAEAVRAMRHALEADPDCREAAELLWSAGKRLVLARPEAPARDSVSEARISSLLASAAADAEERAARRAIAELALLCPDDPRLGELLRDRAEAKAPDPR
jgi:tetratricopeptide (TPR) repeat protein